jgi:hypothetical protein
MNFFNNDLWKNVNNSILYVNDLLVSTRSEITGSVYLNLKNHV